MTGIEIANTLIKTFEGCRLQPYVLPGESWGTVGWGHAIPLNEINQTITQQKADELLGSDLNARDADLKEQLGAIYSRLTSGQLGATLSFKYNCKPILFDSSTFLALLKQGDFAKAQAEFKRWIYGEGHIPLPGLVRRRRSEEFCFAGGTIAELDQFNWFLAEEQSGTLPNKDQQAWQCGQLPPPPANPSLGDNI